MSRLKIKIKYNEKTNTLEATSHGQSNGPYGKRWNPCGDPGLSDNHPDLIKIWPKEHSCRYIYHHGNWYTNC